MTKRVIRILLATFLVGACAGCAGQAGTSEQPSRPEAQESTKKAPANPVPCQSGTDPLTVMGANLGSPAPLLEEKLGKPVSMETNTKYDDEIRQYSFGFIRVSAERKTLKAINLRDPHGNLALWPGVTFGTPLEEVRSQLASLGYCPTFFSAETLRFDRGADVLLLNFEEGRLRGLTLGE